MDATLIKRMLSEHQHSLIDYGPLVPLCLKHSFPTDSRTKSKGESMQRERDGVKRTISPAGVWRKFRIVPLSFRTIKFQASCYISTVKRQ